jgi:hypothetical protein
MRVREDDPNSIRQGDARALAAAAAGAPGAQGLLVVGTVSPKKRAKLSKEALALVKKLLTMDPARRITAKTAQSASYFTVRPGVQ